MIRTALPPSVPLVGRWRPVLPRLLVNRFAGGKVLGKHRRHGYSPAVMYLAVFAGSLGVDLIPVVAPPAWTIMIFLLMKYELNPWAVLAAGVPGSALGRYLFSLYIQKFSDKVVTQRKKQELAYVGDKLKRSIWRTWMFVLIYTVTPLSTTALFTAAGMTKINRVHVIAPFVIGKFASDAVMIAAGRYAVTSGSGLLGGVFSPKTIVTGMITLIVTAAFLFVDWHALLIKRQLAFDFKIWR
jgi:membrane protein YqaA with SNARE-associated domain